MLPRTASAPFFLGAYLTVFGLLTPIGLAAVPLQDPLEAVVVDALRHSPLLALQRASAEEALARARASRAPLLPSAAVESRFTRVRGGIDLGEAVNPANRALNELLGEARFPTDLDLALPLRHETRLRLVVPLVNRPANASREAARHMADGEVAWTGGVARKVAADAQRALLLASAARERRRILETALDRAMEAEDVALHLLAEGLATPAILLQTRADRSGLEEHLEEARSREDAARWTLNRITGRPMDAGLPDLGPALEVPRVEPSGAPLLREELAREELARLDAHIRAAEAGVAAAKAARLPTLALALDPGFQGPRVRFDGDSWTGSLSVVASWTVFGGGRIQAGIEAAEASRARARQARRDAAEGLALELRVAQRGLEAAEAALPAAEARLAAASEVHALTLVRFREGLATPFELTEAREGLTAAEAGRSLARHQRLLAWVEFEAAAALRSLEPRPLEPA
jgi:outer membrane protein TolC